MNLQDARTVIESVHSWASDVHAKYTREDRINPDRGVNKEERWIIVDCAISIMKCCTGILDDLWAIDDAHDSMDAADRSNDERLKQFNEDKEER